MAPILISTLTLLIPIVVALFTLSLDNPTNAPVPHRPQEKYDLPVWILATCLRITYTFAYPATTAGLLISICHSLVQRHNTLPARERTPRRMRIFYSFAGITILTATSLSYNLARFLTTSFQAWNSSSEKNTRPIAFFPDQGFGLQSGDVWTWMNAMAPFHEFTAQLYESRASGWWATQSFYLTFNAVICMAVAARKYAVPGFWRYVALAQLLSPALAVNLFCMSLALTVALTVASTAQGDGKDDSAAKEETRRARAVRLLRDYAATLCVACVALVCRAVLLQLAVRPPPRFPGLPPWTADVEGPDWSVHLVLFLRILLVLPAALTYYNSSGSGYSPVIWVVGLVFCDAVAVGSASGCCGFQVARQWALVWSSDRYAVKAVVWDTVVLMGEAIGLVVWMVAKSFESDLRYPWLEYQHGSLRI